MGDFGAFQVNRPCRHTFGDINMDLEPGRYEPKDADEYTAMEHLASVSVPVEGPDGEVELVPFVVKVENPNGQPDPQLGVVGPPPLEEPVLAEPPPAAAPVVEAPAATDTSAPPAAVAAQPDEE